jgi:hypothetical protein
VVNPGEVAARAVQTGNQAKLHGIVPAGEHDRDRCGGRLGRQCRAISRGHDHSDPAANKIGSKFGQAVMLAVRPAIFDHHVAAFEITLFAKAQQERAHGSGRPVGGSSGRRGVEEPDHRHRCLLCQRRERPGRCTAEQCDELASPT